jgi:UDP-N-acetylmuramoyl-tripeptide--D-alanyl-D-alanine ligase
MGANHGGEIAYLTSLALPDVVVITNAGAAHLEGFGSLTGVAEGKGEILQDAKRPQYAVLNADDDFYDYWRSLADDISVLSFGLGDNADVYASQIEAGRDTTSFLLHLPDESVAIELPLVGVHNVRNACAAAAVSCRAGKRPSTTDYWSAWRDPVRRQLQREPGFGDCRGRVCRSAGWYRLDGAR